MWKKNHDFSSEDLSKLLNSPQAMALAAMLQTMDQAPLSQAANAAQQGDTDAARKLLTPLLKDPQVIRLLSQMGGSDGGV